MHTKQSLSVDNIMQYFSPSLPISSPQIHLFKCLDSTNTWLKNNGKCGDICIAEQQTAGRGRRGNQWLSPDAENIYCSVKWCFNTSPTHLSLLSLVVGLSIAKALEKIGLRGHGVKWPNDIFWQGRKMGGILIEAISSSSQVMQQQLIIGFGLNVNMPSSVGNTIDQPWVSLNDAMGKSINRQQLLVFILEYLVHDLQHFEHLDIQQFQSDWQQWDILRDQSVTILQEHQEQIGVVKGLDVQGRLGIKLNSGKLMYYASADIRLKKSGRVCL